ncbi:uncharacterized protein LOC123310551 [Coccinella septempunctata]|uniref:uncharacterized protein LOC123310551 n=1 Tax=Coccinella septempunctata TaxID=41139 RepID=UPI001D0762F3|nr:uncharacterized protein LOC123310551 [Coccinella septempunctata]
MSSRTKKIMQNALAIVNQKEDKENIQDVANSSIAFENISFLSEAMTPEDMAEMIRDAEIILEGNFCITQKQPDSNQEIPVDTFAKSKEKQENSQTNTVNLIELKNVLSDSHPEEESEENEARNAPISHDNDNILCILQEPEVYQDSVESKELGYDEQIGIDGNQFNIETHSSPKAAADENNDQDFMDTQEKETLLESSSSSNDEATVTKQKRTKGSGRKRELNKKLRMCGKKYIGFRKPKQQKNTFHDYPRGERLLKPRCHCKDSSKQCSKFTDDDRKNIFLKFWSDMSWEQRRVFVATTVKVCDRKRPEVEASRRSVTLKYHLISNNTHLQVCKLMYLNTLSLGEWSARSWALSAANGMVESNEVSVSRRPRREDIFKEDREFLENFLSNLNKLPSHYCRKDTDYLYLEQNFQSWNDLYRVYEKLCEDEKRKVLSSKLLRQMAKQKKIAIFSPRKDQCDLCFMFKNGNLAEEDYKKHIEAKNAARIEKKNDKAQALEGKCHVITMDVQAVKLSPQIPASTLYYKTKLCCHNFTVYDVATKEVVCYWYNETQADGQASTYASFLLDFLEEKFLNVDEKKPIIIYSDGCTPQNRNAILANALLYLSEKNNVKIIQKFLVKGHTQMECDSVHSAIERRLKNKEIYLPSDYLRITIQARPRAPYTAKTKEFDFFRDFSRKDLMKYKSIKPNKPSFVTDIRALEYSQGIVKYKLHFSNEFIELPNRPNKIKDFGLTEFPALYKGRNKITKTKYEHLQTIKKCIPQDCWGFYDNLPFSAK